MIKAAYKLMNAEREYRKLYEQEHKKHPVIWLKNDETGEGFFMADSFNTELIKSRINEITFQDNPKKGTKLMDNDYLKLLAKRIKVIRSTNQLTKSQKEEWIKELKIIRQLRG